MPLAEAKIEGFVGTICLDYFDKRNALSAALVDDVLGGSRRFRAEGPGARRALTRAARASASGRRATTSTNCRRPPRSARLVRPLAPSRPRDREPSRAGHRDDRGRRLGRRVRNGDGLRHRRRRRQRDFRPDAGQARRRLQCLGDADLPQQRPAARHQGDGLHRAARSRPNGRLPPASSTTGPGREARAADLRASPPTSSKTPPCRLR